MRRKQSHLVFVHGLLDLFHKMIITTSYKQINGKVLTSHDVISAHTIFFFR